MDNLLKLIIIFLLIVSQSCKNDENTTDEATKVLPIVSITNPRIGNINTNIQLNGQVVYLNKYNIIAPISGYAVSVNAELGKLVNQGDILYKLQTKESAAMQNSKGSTSDQFGIITVLASSSGIVSSIEISESGSFISEGSTMLTIVKNSDQKIQVNAPYEYSKILKRIGKVKVLLANNEELSASFFKSIPIVDAASQTQQLLFHLDKNILLPENLNVIILFQNMEKLNSIILPKDAVLTNELQDEFWIMKVNSDSIAIKIPITKGIENDSEIQIVSPLLDRSIWFA